MYYADERGSPAGLLKDKKVQLVKDIIARENNKLDGLDIANTVDVLNHYEMGLVAEGHLKEALIRIIKKL